MSNTLVALLDYGCRYSTDNAVTWSSDIVFPGRSPDYIPIQAIAWNGSVFCVTSHGGRDTLTSSDGITWTRHVNALPASGLWDAIAWNGTVFCALDAASHSGAAATSPDGITWTTRAIDSSGQYWGAITWNGSLFFALDTSSYARVCTSPDGITWTNVLPLFTYFNAHDIASLQNGTVCIVFRSGSSSGITLVSTNNGVSWSSGAYSGTGGSVVKLGSDGTNFVRVNGYNNCYTSTDGLSWTSRTISSYQAISCIGWNGSIFYTQAGNSGPGGNRSTNGITWVGDSISGTFYAIGAAFYLFAGPPTIPPPFWKDRINLIETDA